MLARHLLSGPITFSAAYDRSSNILHLLQYPRQKQLFYERIENQRHLLHLVVAHHLGVDSSSVSISPQDEWGHGSFNLCVPALVEQTASTQGEPRFVILRFPLPYRVGDGPCPGNSDEKLRCEAATYAWLQENCPSIPIPKLYGLGLSSGERFTHLDYLLWWSRWHQKARRHLLALFGYPLPSNYVCHKSSSLTCLDTGYLLIETITDADMLSESWDDYCSDQRRLNNLQRDLACMMLSLAKIPLPRIGAFRLDSHGYLQLDNRPMNVLFQMQENERISIDMPKQETFSTVDSFVLKHLNAFDNRLIHQPNAITSEEDAWSQMTSLAGARAIFPYVFRREFSNGPFVFTLTDLHRSNIFVDEEWNIKRIIDLEFACSWPIEFQHPPYWLGGQLIDEIDSTGFAPRHTEFIQMLQEQEAQMPLQTSTETLSSIMEASWKTGAFWATLALKHPVAFTEIFYDRLLEHISDSSDQRSDTDYRFSARFWRPNITTFVQEKLRDRDKYRQELQQAFENTA